MLELIVLGQIPGTNFQLTFLQIAMILASMVIGLLGAQELHIRKQHAGSTEQNIKEITI